MTTTDVLVLDQHPETTESLAEAVQATGRTTIVSNDAAAGRTVLERVPLSWVLSPVSVAGPFRYDGLAIADEARRVAPGVRVLLYAHDVSDELAHEAERCGAAALVPAPVEPATLQRWIEPAAGGGEQSTFRVPSLASVIEGDALEPHFQPIVELSAPRGSGVHGYESLARYRGGAPFVDCEFLFRYAERDHRVRELDLACVARSIRHGGALARDGKLFINLHPQSLAHGSDLLAVLREEAARASVPLHNVVLEITERERVADVEAAVACVEQLRPYGVSFALDDVGSSYSHLELLGRIAPSYLKISTQFGTGFEVDAVKRKIVRNLVALAEEFGCEVILEGIECAATAAAARDLGVRFGQGFHFARPRSAVNV